MARTQAEKPVGACGIYCPACFAYPDDCSGCGVDPRSENCPIYRCAKSKEVKFCLRCEEFPCTIHYGEYVFSKKALDTWKRIKGQSK